MIVTAGNGFGKNNMKWLALTAAMLAGHLDAPQPLPKLPENPVIKFLNEDIWKIHGLKKKCIWVLETKLCADVRDVDERSLMVILKMEI